MNLSGLETWFILLSLFECVCVYVCDGFIHIKV